MKRKINKVGKNTLTVSLPSKWVKENKIESGDEIDLIEEGNSLILTQEENRKIEKEIKVCTDSLTYFSLARIFGVAYKGHYNKLILIHNKKTIIHPKDGKEKDLKKIIHQQVSRQVGAEIVSQTKDKTEIEYLAIENEENLERIERRILYLFKETNKELIDHINNDFKTFYESSYDRHDMISKFINYFLRIQCRNNKNKEENNIIYALYVKLDELADKIRHLSETLMEYKCSDKMKEILIEIFNIFHELYENFISKKQLSQKIIQKRYDIKRKLKKEKLSTNDLRILQEAYFFIELLNYFSDAILIRGIKEDEINFI